MSGSDQDMDFLSDDYVSDYERDQEDDNLDTVMNTNADNDVDSDDQAATSSYTNPAVPNSYSSSSTSGPNLTTSSFGSTPSAASNPIQTAGPTIISNNNSAPVPNTIPVLPSIAPAPAPLLPNIPAAVQNNAAVILNLNTLTPNLLRPINDLTRSAANPGNLQYNEYIAYLISIGHVTGAVGPATPRNSNLQHNTGDRQDDLTDFRADQALWSIQNLPNILYQLSRPATWTARTDLNEPPTKQYLIYGQHLRDLPILPDHISSGVEGWRFEAWVRMDPRVSHANIVARIRPTNRPANKSRIQMRANRFREVFPALGWVTPGKNFRRDQVALNNRLAAAGIAVANNTTRGVSWGLVNPTQGPAGGQIPVPEAQPQETTVDQSAINGTPLASVVPTMMAVAPVTAPVTAPAAAATTTTAPAPLVPAAVPTIPAPAQAGPAAFVPPSLVPHPPQFVVAAPAAPAREVPATVTYQGRVLTLRTQAERAGMSPETAVMMTTFFPAASEGRDRQLEYILCPIRAPQGFIDNHGFWEYFPPDPEASSTDKDVIYVAGL